MMGTDRTLADDQVKRINNEVDHIVIIFCLLWDYISAALELNLYVYIYIYNAH